jgi:hypothetical protein
MRGKLMRALEIVVTMGDEIMQVKKRGISGEFPNRPTPRGNKNT